MNVLRLLTELFRQPTLRQSEAQIRLLLPPLLGPLQEALVPALGWVLLPFAEQPQKHRSAQKKLQELPWEAFRHNCTHGSLRGRPLL